MIQCGARLSVPRLSFLPFLYLISKNLFCLCQYFFGGVVLFQAAVQVAAVLINGKTSKVALKERHTRVCVCV